MRNLLPVVLVSLACAAYAQDAHIKLWPHGAPDSHSPNAAAAKRANPDEVTAILDPYMVVRRPTGPNSGSAVLVFPGGGYQYLNMRKTGTEPCDLLSAQGMTCFIVVYRVPLQGRWPEQRAMLDDAQQAIRLVRAHAADYGIDPKKIGLWGSSAGANDVILLATHPDDPGILNTPSAVDVPRGPDGQPVDARAAFNVACWPAYEVLDKDPSTLDPAVEPTSSVPPTFIIQAENDPYGLNAPVYYLALQKAKIPAELHIYPTGGHGFGMHPAGTSQQDWPQLALNWLRFIHMLPSASH